MQTMRLAALALFVIGAGTTHAFAQQTPAPQPAQRGILVGAHTGASFGGQTAAVLGGEFAERISRNVQAYLAISYHEDLMTSDLHDQLDTLSTGLTAITGTAWDLQGRDRGVSFIVGARRLFGDGSGTRPYLGGGAGVINVRRTISDPRVGDVTAATLTEFGIGAANLTNEALTRPLVEGTGGIILPVGRAAYVDLGYRYRRAFHVGETLDFSQFTASIGVRF